MMRSAIVIALLALPAIAQAQPAGAQTQNGGRFELSGGLQWSGAVSYDSVDAVEKTRGNGTRTVFTSNSSLEAGAGWHVRAGVGITRALSAEISASRTNRELVATIGGDVENAAGAPGETVGQYLIEGGIRYRLGSMRGGRLRPFITAGAGYLRDLNEGSTLAETGHSYYAGGGAYYLLRQSPRSAIKGIGVRGDVRASITDGGVALDDAVHVGPTAGIGLFLTF